MGTGGFVLHGEEDVGDQAEFAKSSWRRGFSVAVEGIMKSVEEE